MATVRKTPAAAGPTEVTAQTEQPAAPKHIPSELERVSLGVLPKYLENWTDTLKLLEAPFHPDDVFFLPQTINYDDKTAVAAAYADSRVYTARLNEVIGTGFWQSEVTDTIIAPFTKYIKEKRDWKTKEVTAPASQISAHKIGSVVRVGLWMGPVLGWVYQDSTGAKDTADENWITSAEAQAYKRAMSKWGPGKYFYAFGKQSYPYDTKTGKWKQQPLIPDWAYPTNHCTDCGKQIVTVNYQDKEGITKSIHAWDVYLRSMQQFGEPLCPVCSKVRRDKSTTPEANARLQGEKAA
jgi:hypothetical protein